MSLGDGIFLGALFLGLVLLYIATKDRWKWKAIFRRGAFVIVGAIAVIGLGAFAYFKYSNWPEAATGLGGVRIGASPADVKFSKGEPSKIRSITLTDPDGKSHDEPLWIYEGEHTYYVIYFGKGSVTRILAGGDRLYLPSIKGVSTYDSIESLISKLGEPSHVSRSKSDLERIYSFAKYNVAFTYSKGEMETVIVGVTQSWPSRFVEEASP